MSTQERTQNRNPSGAEDDIRAEQEAYFEALNSGDPAEAASFFADDGIRVDPGGDVEVGRQAVEAALDTLLRRTMPGARIVPTIPGDVRMLTQEHAIWRGLFNITRPEAETIPAHGTLIYRKDDGRWMIIEAHPKYLSMTFTPPQPGGGA